MSLTERSFIDITEDQASSQCWVLVTEKSVRVLRRFDDSARPDTFVLPVCACTHSPNLERPYAFSPYRKSIGKKYWGYLEKKCVGLECRVKRVHQDRLRISIKWKHCIVSEIDLEG